MIRKAIIVMMVLGAVTAVTLTSVARMGGGSLRWEHYRTGGTQWMVNINKQSIRLLVRTPTPEGHQALIISFGGFVYFIGADARDRIVWHDVRLPLWLVVAGLVSYPGIAFVYGPLRRYRRRKNGQCLKCGYDLTGNVTGRCPECGVHA